MDLTASDAPVFVIGGGPGGSAAASVLAQAGLPVVLLERARFPRFHVGESLVPGSHMALDVMGLDQELAARAFVVKRGAVFETDCGDKRARVDFKSAPGLAHSTTYHVPRADFDELLFAAARRAGAQTIEEARVLDFSKDREGVELSWETPAGREQARGRFLIDASGRAGVVAKKLGLRIPDPELRKAALFGHFDGLVPCADADPGDLHIVVRGDGGWAWMIPLQDGRSSVGFVFDHAEAPKLKSESPEDALARWIASTPAVARRMRAAERVGPARWEGNFAYSTSAFAGAGWALVGDAAAFLDPIFSTGVHLALMHGIDVARDVARASRRGRSLEARAVRRSERAQRRRLATYRRLVHDFYRPAFRDLFFRPERWPASARALTALLAGVERLSPANRLRVAAFRAIVSAHERWGIVPRASESWERPPRERHAPSESRLTEPHRPIPCKTTPSRTESARS